MNLTTPEQSSAKREPSALPVARHWIDGEWVGSDVVSDSINPATGAVLGHWADGGEAEARAAIAAARGAFETSPWSRDRDLRNKALLEMADRFDAHADELGALVTKENGKRLREGTSSTRTQQVNGGARWRARSRW